MSVVAEYRERTNLRVAVASLLLFVLGVLLLVCSEAIDYVSSRVWLKATLANFGALLVATISLAAFWELVSKRAFLQELLAKAGVVADVTANGLIGITSNPLHGPDFQRLINNTKRLDMFICYASTWRAAYEDELRHLLQNSQSRVRLIAPNPDNSALMEAVAPRFGAATPEILAEKIRIAIEESSRIFRKHDPQGIRHSIWVHEESPAISFFLFDSVAVMTIYKHARGRGSAPTFTVERGGELFRYVESEVDAMVVGLEDEAPLARRLFPPQAATQTQDPRMN